MKNIDILRPLKNSDKISLEGFKEYIERYIELSKAKQIIFSDSGISETSYYFETISFQQTLLYLKKYINGQLGEDYNAEARMISEYLEDALND